MVIKFESKVLSLNSCKKYKYVIIVSLYHDNWLLCRHKERSTWELPGGHIEENESPLEAAKRELYEETGALEYDITPIFDYWLDDGKTSDSGVVYLADVFKLDLLPSSEMEEVAFFEELPTNLTYPQIYSDIFIELKKRKVKTK